MFRRWLPCTCLSAHLPIVLSDSSSLHKHTHTHTNTHIHTQAMAFGIIPAFFVGASIAFLRQASFFRKGLCFKAFRHNVKSRLIAK